MPNKYQVITEMEAEHLRTLTVNTDHYMDFLTTAANNFKYSFQEQLLIFAQKPDATACAEVSWWNKHGRWVNRNTKGIALLVDTDAPYKLRHVFDVSDTNSRVQGLPLNRALRDEDNSVYDIVAGTFFVCDCSTENFKSLNEEQLKRYTEKYKRPERFMRVDDQILAIPMPIKSDKERER